MLELTSAGVGTTSSLPIGATHSLGQRYVYIFVEERGNQRPFGHFGRKYGLKYAKQFPKKAEFLGQRLKQHNAFQKWKS